MSQVHSLDGKWKFTRLAESTLDHCSRPVRKPKARSIQVPSNWYLQGEDFAGEALYEREFTAPVLKPGQAAYLRFKGADYFLRAELNGKPLGRHEGYFQAFEFPATSALREKNHLKVWVESPKESRKAWPHWKHLIKGIFNHHDTRPGSWDDERGQDHNTGGLWNSVELVIVDQVYLKEVRTTPKLLPGGKAQADLKLTLVNFAQAEAYDLQVDFEGEGFPHRSRHRKNVRLERGQSEVHLREVFKKPRLWWTWDQGEPNLYRVSIAVHRSRDGRVVERAGARFGLRELRVTSDWKFFLNGRKFFPRGTNIIPTQWLSEYGAKEARRDVGLMKAANLNAVRVHAHVNRREFYEACDEAGLFVWQDFALQWSYKETPAFVREACRQIKDMVRLLYNHASVLVWCCHNEPSFNRDSLDPILARAVKEEDASRFVDVASDFRYHPYPGWYVEDSAVKDAPGVIGPGVTFLSEFGAQALPSVAALKRMFKPKELWPPDWKAWAWRDFQYFQTFNVAKVERGRSLPEFVANSQAHQAYIVKEHITSFRLRKYSPMNGYFHFMFVDCWPSITWSVVDYFRNPKAGYGALKTASQPLLPVWRLHARRFNPGDVLFPGESLLEGVTLVNDFPRPFRDLKVEVSVKDPRGRALWGGRGTCNLPPDSIVQPFKARMRWNHIKVFHLPAKAPLGQWKVEVRVKDRTGRLLAGNQEAFQVVKKA